jgi:hemoglobin
MKKNIVLGIISLIIISGFLVHHYSDRLFAQSPVQVPPPSLYDRLGGSYSIAGVVDDFIERLLIDPVVTANKNVTSAMGRITKAGLKFHITEMVCEACGGPQKYTGRSMKDSHAHLGISEAEWQAMEKDFLNSLKKFSVPEKEQNELVAIVRSTKADIVAAKKETTAKAKVAEPDEKAPESPPVIVKPPEIPGLPADEPAAPEAK